MEAPVAELLQTILSFVDHHCNIHTYASRTHHVAIITVEVQTEQLKHFKINSCHGKSYSTPSKDKHVKAKDMNTVAHIWPWLI